jgi:hypothetical protein
LRVLKPGGLLLVTNRTGSGRWLLFGKTYSTDGFTALLKSLGQIDITTQVWQYDYDLVWSIKPDADKTSAVFGNRGGLATLHCPACRAPLDRSGDALTCRSCGRRYPIGADGVIELL